MKICHVAIRNFRGIRECEWHVQSHLVCLVGPGDSTKTTVLDAMDLALCRTYGHQFTDADFYCCDTTKPIRIEVAVADLPPELVQEKTFGLDRSGIWPNGRFEHDPIDGTDECLIVRLEVDQCLEPRWTVVRPGEEDGDPINASHRRSLGFLRLGEHVDRHLRWSPGSALSAMTGGLDDASAIVLGAHRGARRDAFDRSSSELQETSNHVRDEARAFGASQYGHLRPGLDPGGVPTSHALLLHDETVPLTNKGLGTRRLTSLSIQAHALSGGAIIAVDEIEHGLEPHRLVHLLRNLRQKAKDRGLQVFLTTHSPVAVTTLQASELSVVQCDNGQTVVRQVPADLDDVQGVVRYAPAALLGKKVLVTEGAAEVGLVRGLCAGRWDPAQAERGLATTVTDGFAVVNGRGGATALKRARAFRKVGFESGALVDSDDLTIDSQVETAVDEGVVVHRWTAGRALEDEIVYALSDEGLQQFIDLAIEARGEESVIASVSRQLGGAKLESGDPVAWMTDGCERVAVVEAIASAAKGRRERQGGSPSRDRGWFKSESGGEQLAELLIAQGARLTGTALVARLRDIKEYIYGHGQAS